MLVSDNEERIEKVRFWSTQAREKARHYQHKEIGYNYRMSNIVAGIGRGQLKVLDKRIEKKKYIFEYYKKELGEIKDLAYNLIRLSGLEPEVDIEIKYTGLRPGEKLYEELLITSDNNQTSTVIDKVFIEEPIPVDETILFDTIKNIECAARELDREKIFELMEKLCLLYTSRCV